MKRHYSPWKRKEDVKSKRKKLVIPLPGREDAREMLSWFVPIFPVAFQRSFM